MFCDVQRKQMRSNIKAPVLFQSQDHCMTFTVTSRQIAKFFWRDYSCIDFLSGIEIIARPLHMYFCLSCAYFLRLRFFIKSEKLEYPVRA